MNTLDLEKKTDDMILAIKEAIYNCLSEEGKYSKDAQAGHVLMALLMIYYEIGSAVVDGDASCCISGLKKVIASLEELYKKE